MVPMDVTFKFQFGTWRSCKIVLILFKLSGRCDQICQNFKSLGQNIDGQFCVWKILIFVRYFFAFGQIFNAVNGQILNISFGHLVTLIPISPTLYSLPLLPCASFWASLRSAEGITWYWQLGSNEKLTSPTDWKVKKIKEKFICCQKKIRRWTGALV